MRRFTSSMSWLFFGQIARILSQLLGISVIARLLVPSDFGVIAIALMVSNLAGLLRDMGTGPAAIRSPDGSMKFLGGIYSIQLFIGLILACILLLLATPLAEFYRTEALANVLAILSTVFPISALGGVHLIALERDQRYRDIAVIDLMSYISGLLVAIGLASLGLGVESLAIQAVITAATQTVLQRRVADIALRPMHPRNAQSAAGGSLAVTSFQLMNYLVRNSDITAAGRLATTDFVGTYSMAGRIAQLPIQLIGMLIARISVPILSEQDTDPAIRARNIERLIAGTLLASAIVCLGLVAMRQTVTSILFGAKWLGSLSPQLVWLLPAAALTSTSAVVVGVMTAVGATSALTRTGLLGAAAHACALIIGLSVNIYWLPAAILLSALMNLAIAIIHLRMIQSDLSMSPMRITLLIPVTILLVSYAFWCDTLLLPRQDPESMHTVGHELLEGAGIMLLMLFASAKQWRAWLPQQPTTSTLRASKRDTE